MSLAENPGVSVGTRNPRMPSSVWAQTTAMSAIEPLVIHIFDPFSTHASPSRLADVRMWFGSLPKSASVNPKHPITSPVAILGSQCCFCSSVPNSPDREHAERSLDAHERTEPRIARLELQARETVRDGVRAETPVSLQVHAQQPKPAELEGDVLGERAGLEPPVDAREDVVCHPLAHQVAHLPLLGGEQMVDVEEIERIGSFHGRVA